MLPGHYQANFPDGTGDSNPLKRIALEHLFRVCPMRRGILWTPADALGIWDGGSGERHITSIHAACSKFIVLRTYKYTCL